MVIKLIILGLIIFMIYNLFRALFIMTKPDKDKPKMSKYIGRRVLTSFLIVMILLVCLATGIITPNPRPY